MMASLAETSSAKDIRRYKEPRSVNFIIWTELQRDGEMEALKLEYTMQQDTAIKYGAGDCISLL
jgi:hypothetical protein